MYFNIKKEAKLNSFKPVKVVKPKDVFRRHGYRHMPHQDGEVADFSRNPLQFFDSESKKMNDYYYEQYRKQVESEKQSVQQSEVKSEEVSDTDQK